MRILSFALASVACIVRDGSAFAPSSNNDVRLTKNSGWNYPSKIANKAVNGDHGAVQASNGIAPNSVGEATMRLGSNTGPTVWTEFARLAAEFEPVNLGQGFPDWLPPKFAVDSLVEAVLDSAQSPHQYTRTAGHPNLVSQLARRYSTHMNRDIDPMKEVAVTVGASQALYMSLQTLIQPGMLGGTCFVFVCL